MGNGMCLDKFWAKINATLHYQCAFSVKKNTSFVSSHSTGTSPLDLTGGRKFSAWGSCSMGRVGHITHPKFWLAGHTAFDGTNNCPVCSLILRKIGKTWCPQMSDLRTKMHQILFRSLGLRPRPSWGAYSAPPDLAVFKGPTSKGREKKEREEKGRGTVVDPAIWAHRVAAPPHWPKLRTMVVATRSSLPQTRGQVLIQILNFWPLFVWQYPKSFQLQRALSPDSPRPWTPRTRLANPGSATGGEK